MALSAPRRFCSLAAAVALIGSTVSARASTEEEEVRAAFDRFVQVQNAHDAAALESLLADSPDFLWITRGAAIWGRAAALQRFAKLYEGTWHLDPDSTSVRVVPVADGVAQLHASVQYTIGAPDQAPQVTRFLLNEVLVRSESGWRVMSLLPIPGPAH